ncbi:DUF2262 domain-containing protein [Clostridium sp. AWRP]|nr:DUF2262 domain-containing protein [Clostridium sp. AWRP]
MKASLKTAYELFKNQKHWSDKIRKYAASELWIQQKLRDKMMIID